MFVGLFKRIVQRGTPTPSVMARVSRNLSLLRDNHEEVRAAHDISRRQWQGKLQTHSDDLLKSIDEFKSMGILRREDRKILTEFNVKVPKDVSGRAKVERQFGNIEQRALEECCRDFLPKFLQKLQEEQNSTGSEGVIDDIDDENDQAPLLDPNDPEYDAGLGFDWDEE